MIENFAPLCNSDQSKTNDEEAYWFIFNKIRLLAFVTENSVDIPVFNKEQLKLLPVKNIIVTGIYKGKKCYAAYMDNEQLPAGFGFRLLRELYGAVDDDLFFIAGYAFDVAHWNHTHQFCGACGSKTENREHERAKVCPSCNHTCYPRISPAVIVAVLKDNKILMGRSAHFKPEFFSVLAGYVDLGESLEECVKREIKEETNIEVTNIRYFDSQPWPFSHSLMVGFIADYDSGEINVDNDEVLEARWFSKEELPKIPGKISIARSLIDWFIENY